MPGEDSPSNPVQAWWSGLANTWKAALALGVVLVLGTAAAVISTGSSGGNGGSSASTTVTSTQGGSAASTTSSTPEGNSAVRLTIMAYDQPPCPLPLVINS